MKLTKNVKIILTAIIILILVEVNSFVGSIFFPIKSIAWLIVIGLAFGLTLYKTEYGLYFILGELTIGGKGYLLDFFGLPLRMGLFAAVVTAWLINTFRKKEGYKIFFQKKMSFLPYLLLAISIIFGIINGLLSHDLNKVYADANAWLFFILLPLFLLFQKSSDFTKNAISIILIGATWLSVKTVFFLFLFSNQYALIGDQIYAWIRNTGVGEITFMSGNNFRVFFYSQIYCLFAAFIIGIFIINLKILNRKKTIIYLGLFYLYTLSILISQSRSFWLAGALGSIVLILFFLTKLKRSFAALFLYIFIFLLMLGSQLFITQLITGSILNNRLNNLSSEPAGASRLNQLSPLARSISQNPVFGYGFGKTLTYKSQDPRILKANPDGNYTTYAFEWGYLDIWLKLGIIGLLGYFAAIFFLLTRLFNNFKSFSVINTGLAFSLIVLIIVNMFTPYLNHPLGIGLVLICAGAIEKNKISLC